MGFITSLLVVYGVAGLVLGGAVTIAIALYLHHQRRSQVVAYAAGPSASPSAVREGFALLRGEVGPEDAAPEDAVITVEIPWSREESGHAATGLWRTRARAFSLRLPSGAEVRVEPASGGLSLDTTFVPTSRDGVPTYVAEVRPGDAIYIAGSMRREIDAGAAGKGYRDAGRVWVLRAPAYGNLCICSERVIARHAQRARFHRTWALVLGSALAALHLGLFRPYHEGILKALGPTYDIGTGQAALAVFFVGAAALAYRTLATHTSPWTELRVQRRNAA